MKRIFLILALSACVASELAAHAFHASLAELELNSKSKRIELAIRLFSDDLENALSRHAGTRVKLDTSAGIDRRISDYVNSHFILRDAKGKQVKLQFVGKESDVQTTWVYFEAPFSPARSKFTLHDVILLDLFADQVNSVNVKRDVRKGSLVFQRGDSAKLVP